jgi:steroid 5-alpha reductase family enzyme
MSPLLLVVIIAAGASAFAWIASLITKDTSWVDRLWSVIPVVYVWVFAIAAGMQDARLNVIAVLVTVWGARLTYNFARKGGYTGVEDYRWAILRGRMTGWQFQLFNLFFIVIYQNAILVLITLAAFTAYENQGDFGLLDVAVAALFLLLLLGETVADQQQWVFHKAKAAGAAETRFLTTGLWKFSRHPNFFFEQAQWWALFIFGAVAAGSLLQWTVLGPLLLTLLFVGSTVFTESITKSKYPEYADYQATTSPIVPWFSRAPKASRAVA